jgi:hypothetical protein
MTYPKKTVETLDKISRQNGIPLENIQKAYDDLFNNPVLINQGIDEEERHNWASVAIWSQFKASPDNPEYSFIPIGLTGENETSTGKMQAEIYGIVSLTSGAILRRVVMFGEACQKLNEVALPTQSQSFGYNVKLGQFKDGGDMIADQKSVFEDPQIFDQNILDILTNKFGTIRVGSLAETIRHPSKIDGNNWVDKTDLRVITGFIVSQSNGTRDNGTEWGNYRITDLSLGDDDVVTEDGNVMRRTQVVWLSPKLMVYPENSICDFLGTIVLKKNDQNDSLEPQFNAILVIPKISLGTN